MKFVPRTLAGAAVVIALGVSGCGTPPVTEPTSEALTEPSADDRIVGLPGDTQPGEDTLNAMTHGVLTADDEGCVWLIDPPVKDEPFEPEVALFWPADYSFDTSTKQILDPAGEVVAAIADRVSLGGGETPHRTSEWPAWCDAANRAWSVSSIELSD